jgi:hypothetical protein
VGRTRQEENRNADETAGRDQEEEPHEPHAAGRRRCDAYAQRLVAPRTVDATVAGVTSRANVLRCDELLMAAFVSRLQ